MMTPSLLIVTDRGGLRAYKVEPNPSCPPALHLLDSFETQEAHGRYDDKVTDQAGRFKASGMPNQQTSGTAAHNTIDLENDTAYADLLRVDPSKLAGHFPALQHA